MWYDFQQCVRVKTTLKIKKEGYYNMLDIIESVNTAVNNFIWGVPAMICIIGVGLYLSLRARVIQNRTFAYAIRSTLRKGIQ